MCICILKAFLIPYRWSCDFLVIIFITLFILIFSSSSFVFISFFVFVVCSPFFFIDFHSLSFYIFEALTLVAVRRICLFFQIKFTTFWYLVIPFRLDILCIILIIQLVIGFNANFPDLPIDTHIKCKFVADTDVYIRCYWDPWNVQIVGCNRNVSLFPQGDTLTCKP